MSRAGDDGGIVARPTIAREAGLSAYVSALHAEWLASEPGRTWRAVDGSLVFADVSGFTPLAEKLARHGKVGAEELTDTLNLVFRSLLEVAGGLGGDCLKFGGDALLLLFTGDGHARAAAAAAHGMLATLHAMRREHSGAGLARLDMSVGVHTGPVHAFLVGASHRELLLAGPTVSGTLALESLAEAGEILVSDDVAAQLHGGDVDETARTGLLLRRAPMITLAEPHAIDVAALAAAPDGIPSAVRAHLDGTHVDGEHRPSTIGFLKFGGIDQSLAELGPEPVGERLAELIERVQDACELHAVTFLGTDVDRDGGKVLLAAGTPAASPDDEDRMLLALRHVLDHVRSVPLRAGVNRGRIFAVDLGGVERRTYTVMGDAVNLAARVMAAAKWGEIVATQDVLDRGRTDFELIALPPFMVKGKSEPISAQVVGRARGRRDDETGATPLIGRVEEMGVIRNALAAAHEDRGSIVELIGEPGIGKSRLVNTVKSLDHGLARFSFEAGRYSLATPYFALRRGMREAMGLHPDAPAGEVEAALRSVVATVAPDLAEWTPLLGIPLGIELPDTPATASLDPSNRPARLQAVVVDLMRRVLVSPTLITVEDSHWLDAASCDLLVALFDDIERRPWAVLVTRRDVTGGLALPPSRALRSLRLEPLGGEHAASLVRATAAGVELPPGVVDELVARSGGNPLFLQELLVAAMHGSLDEVPDSVEAVVAANIDTLSPRDRSVLRHAAVLGGHFPMGVLAPMLDAPTEQVAADVARLDHFLAIDAHDAVRFKHILLRDVAYEGLPFRTRRSLHDRAATILERSTSDPDSLAELLSIHFDRAGRPRESWRYSRVAGERAQRNGAPVEAAGFYGRALEAARRLGDIEEDAQAEVAERLGDTWELSGRYEKAATAYTTARGLAHDDRLRRSRICRKMGLVRDHQGLFATAQRWFARGIKELAPEAARAEAQALRAELTNAAVTSRMRQGRLARAVPLLERAIADAKAARNDEALARAYCVLDQVLFAQGRFTEATYSDAAATIYERLGNHRGAAEAYNEKGTTAYWCGRWDQAVADYEQAMDNNRRAGGLVHVAINLNNIGEIRSDQGRLDEASELLEEARSLWAGAGWRDAAAWAVSNLGRVALRAGRDDEAGVLLSEASAKLAELGVEPLLLQTDAREIERHVVRGRADEALRLIEDMTPRVERAGLASVALMIDRLAGYAWAQAGDPVRAIELLDKSLAGCRASGVEYEAALALEGLGRVLPLVGDDDLGADRAAEANATFDRLGVVFTPTVPITVPG